MKKVTLSGLAILMLVQFEVVAQQAKGKELKIGDVVPEMEIMNIINYSGNSIKFSDFKGKLLILDFWATWCSPCIASFPKLDSLQKKFDGKIQIIGVTSETKEVVAPIISKLKEIKHVNPVSVISDNQLNKLFPHTSLPHCVWINEEGKVVAITEGKDVNAANIQSLLNKSNLNLVEKKDEKLNVVIDSKPFASMFHPAIKTKEENKVVLSTVPKEDVIIYSTLTRYIPGIAGGTNVDATTLRATNKTIKGLYQVALWHFKEEILAESKTIVDIPDSNLYNKISKPNYIASGLQYLTWLKDNNGYCYELHTPEAMQDTRFDIMIDELNRYFGSLYGIEGVIEKRNTQCLALIRTTQDDKMASKGGAKNHEISKFKLKIQNYPIRSLILLLRQPLQLQPFIIDETNYKGYVDLDINCQLSDLNSLNAELEKYGLKFVEKQRTEDIAVIRVKK